MINRTEEEDNFPTRPPLAAGAAPEDGTQRKDDSLRWLEEHSDFRPFGYEW